MQDDAKKEFVEDGLTAAVPNQFEELVREAGGEVRVRERGSDAPSHLSEVSGGLLQLLGVLSAVACTPDGGTVAFDDRVPELAAALSSDGTDPIDAMLEVFLKPGRHRWIAPLQTALRECASPEQAARAQMVIDKLDIVELWLRPAPTEPG